MSEVGFFNYPFDYNGEWLFFNYMSAINHEHLALLKFGIAAPANQRE